MFYTKIDITLSNTKLTFQVEKIMQTMKLKRAKCLYSRVSTWPAIQLRTDFIPPNQITSNLQRENDPMATVDDVDPIIYPAFCFKASPTNFTWVKMAIADVHRLQKPKNFDGKWCWIFVSWSSHLLLFLSFICVIYVVVIPFQRSIPIIKIPLLYLDETE